TLYGHASALCVKVGDNVKAGDVIATVGRTGNATGYHLHFEVKSGSRNLNPAPYIGL
ncbi:MAG: M23 family metallopeptidase, partial [Clostridia bacterium]|nr:M23 family metallopeptidase [Clostridia bacterium]